MKHLSLHQTEQDFLLDELDAFPHVSYIEETEDVEYIPEITTGGIGDIYYMPAGGGRISFVSLMNGRLL